MRLSALLCLFVCSDALRVPSVPRAAFGSATKISDALRAASAPRAAPRGGALTMGLFDSLKSAFANEEFKEDDQRVRASHILIKGDSDVERVVELMGEIGETVGEDLARLGPVFAQVARRESACASAAQGGDLGLFGPGKMVPEFDAALFPDEDPPPPGTMLGPVVTDFGCHAILVTKREVNLDQVEEKLARND